MKKTRTKKVRKYQTVLSTVTLSLSITPNKKMDTNLQSSEVRIPKSSQSPVGCAAFKSSFARSLSFSTNNQHKPLDVEISFRIAQNIESPIEHHHHHSSNLLDLSATPMLSHKVVEVDEDFEEFMRNSPLKQSMQNLSTKTSPATPTRNNGVMVTRALSTSCSNRHRFQVSFDSLFIRFSFVLACSSKIEQIFVLIRLLSF